MNAPRSKMEAPEAIEPQVPETPEAGMTPEPEAQEPEAPESAEPDAVSGARTSADAPAEADAAGESDVPENGAAVAASADKADEYLELAKRTKADFENYRKRAVREAAAAQSRGVIKLAKELLPAVDNLDRAVKAADGAEGDLVSGIKLVHAEVLAALARVGIEPYSPEGEPFDPEHHEAVAQQPVEGAEPGTVVEVYQRGYRLGETVLRPARVVVAG
jgi:molecular chaperone GrpE